MEEVRQENDNGPFWPHKLRICESRHEQELQERFKNDTKVKLPLSSKQSVLFMDSRREASPKHLSFPSHSLCMHIVTND